MNDKPNYLNVVEEAGIEADVHNAREALDKIEAALRDGAHPTTISDLISEVDRWMQFARSFARTALERETLGQMADRLLRPSDW